MMQGETVSVIRFINIPFSIFAGMAVGLLAGRLFAVYFEKIHIRDTTKVLFRMAGVLVCLFHTGFAKKEKLFTMLAYTPKATVQAAIGGIPLAMGFACGDVVLAVAVLAIVLTAPLGALAIDSTYKKLLKRENR